MKKIKLGTFVMAMSISVAMLVGCGANDASDSETPPAEQEQNENEEGVVKEVTGEELVKMNSEKEKDNVLIIDVRSPEEYLEGHIPNAINMNVDGMEERLMDIEDLKDFPIIVYSNTGNKSEEATEFLLEKDFVDVSNAEGLEEYDYELVKYQDVRGNSFEKFIEGDLEHILVDVRPAKQVEEEGMIEGAINIPYDAVEENLDKLPKDKMIALYCNTGTKSAEVAQELEELGYTNVLNSIEGVKEYPFTLVK